MLCRSWWAEPTLHTQRRDACATKHIAADANSYVDLAVRKANELGAIAALRTTLRERVATSAFGDAARSYSYSIVRAPFPVSGYLSTLRVQQAADGNRSRVEWSGKFTPEGVSAAEASRLFRNIFEDGLKALATKFT